MRKFVGLAEGDHRPLDAGDEIPCLDIPEYPPYMALIQYPQIWGCR